MKLGEKQSLLENRMITGCSKNATHWWM